jgi:hypothetical protein
MLSYQPTNPLQALILADAHVKAIGHGEYSPIDFIKHSHKIEAGIFSNAALRESDLLPGVRLKSGSSQIEIVKLVPTRKEVIFKNKVGTMSRMTTTKFINLARQQGYRKIWNLTSFLETLKGLLKPLLAAVPLMWVLKLVVNSVRNKPIKFATSLPKEAKDLG